MWSITIHAFVVFRPIRDERQTCAAKRCGFDGVLKSYAVLIIVMVKN